MHPLVLPGCQAKHDCFGLAGTALLLLPAVAQAVEFSVSGQVNRLIMNIDNGVESGVVHTDNTVSATRWRIDGSGASDSTTEADLSATNVIQYSGGSNDLLGSMEYGSSDVIVDQVRSNFDGLSRNDNICYDAALGPVRLAVSTGNGSKVELAARYGLENLKVEFGLWDENDGGLGFKGFGTSVSWLGDRGFNVSASMGGDDRDGDPLNVTSSLATSKANPRSPGAVTVTSRRQRRSNRLRHPLRPRQQQRP